MNKWTKRLCVLMCCLWALAPLASAMAAGVDMDAEMGYGGVITYMRELPINVTLTNNGGDTSGHLIVDIDSDYRTYDRYTLPLSIAAGATVNATIPVRLVIKQAAYTIRWEGERESTQVDITPQATLNPSTLVVGVWSEHPQGLSYMSIGTTGDVLKRGEAWQTVALDAATFPASASAMNFFDMLVVDGMDAATLSAAQQGALDSWLRNGGIVVVGGGAQAATAFPYFFNYSGITAGALEDSQTLSQDLLELFKLSDEPLEQPVKIAALRGAQGRAIGDDRIVDLTRVDNGYLFTAAFSLSERPLSTWMGQNVIWQRMLLSYAQSRYTSIFNSRASVEDQYISAYSVAVPNEGAIALPIVLLVLFVGLAGFGGYFIMKKLDRRDWLWAVIPGLCLAFALGIWGVSGLVNMREPIAVSSTVVEVDQDGNHRSSTSVMVAQAEPSRPQVALNQGDMYLLGNSYYYDNGEEETIPHELRNEINLGTPKSVTFKASTSWSTNSFLAQNIPLADVNVKGEAGWEGLKLVFTLTNTGSVALGEGMVITDYGYVSVPALLPGQTVTAQMAPRTETDSSGMPKLMDGRLLSDAERSNFSYYEYLSSYRQDLRKKGQSTDGLSILESYGSMSNWYTGIPNPVYAVFSDELGKVDVSINGAQVTRKGQLDLLAVELKFNPISPDGTVRFLKGYITVTPAEVDALGVPHAGDVEAQYSGYASYRLSTEPVFAFDMNTVPKDMVLEHMDIMPRYSYYGYNVELYRVADGEWVQFKNHSGNDRSTAAQGDAIVLPELQAFIDEDGMLYARFTAYGTTDDYADITMPSLTMDGRIE